MGRERSHPVAPSPPEGSDLDALLDALHQAICVRDVAGLEDAIRLLHARAKRAEPGRRPAWGAQALCWAIRTGNVDILRRLLRWGLNPNGFEPHTGDTPLMTAIERWDINAVLALLAHRADPNLRPPGGGGGYTSLHLTASVASACMAIIRAISSLPQGPTLVGRLIEHGADLTLTDARGRTPLDLAIELDGGRFGTVSSMLMAGAAMAAERGHGPDEKALARMPIVRRSAPFLPILVENAPAALIEALIRHGDGVTDPEAFVNAPSSFSFHGGDRPLHRAVACENLPVVEVLLRFGARPELPGARGRNALHAAADSTFGDHRLMGLLLSALPPERLRACCNMPDEAGRTPLHLAVSQHGIWNERRETIVKLILAGADLKARDADGRTPLDLISALLKYHREELELILKISDEAGARLEDEEDDPALQA